MAHKTHGSLLCFSPRTSHKLIVPRTYFYLSYTVRSVWTFFFQASPPLKSYLESQISYYFLQETIPDTLGWCRVPHHVLLCLPQSLHHSYYTTAQKSHTAPPLGYKHVGWTSMTLAILFPVPCVLLGLSKFGRKAEKKKGRKPWIHGVKVAKN